MTLAAKPIVFLPSLCAVPRARRDAGRNNQFTGAC